MSMLLAKDDTQAILQVGSYRTDNFENLDGTGGSAKTDIYEFTKSVRLKSYGGDNWVTRGNTAIETIIVVSGAGDASMNDTYTYDPSVKRWVAAGLISTIDFVDNQWVMSGLALSKFVCTSIKGINPPVDTSRSDNTGTWIQDADEPAVFPTPTITEYVAAVDQEGLLLENGEEITMLVYASESIATIGGILNIVPVEK